MTPTQMLERVGFTSTQLSTPVKDLSGGQKRRLQLLLILLSEPNVLILDEPTNDLELRTQQLKGSSGNASGAAAGAPDATAAKAKPKLGGAELRNSQKEHAAAGRKIAKLQDQIAELHQRMAAHDQSDFAGLGALVGEQQALQEALDTVETRWLELDELLS